ncbi:hypothetical protein THASP1DRAFT_15415 [Thamnocephalis sphaerospora]|uniref:Acetyl-CoA synthetase-like protein n=1 Tax=Thamnocephalis sphaerospora TaxID=78915 RepID=A0A4V1IWT1_9FUNG|nr:hypothetical protein THASP1DRAFT_15415 [Thamnocephalis sphaerospora]|eukprot:RKP08639.1 hypothetical protein THASP1DRAFT_15415 [Thamnocephalis sphaerospora]
MIYRSKLPDIEIAEDDIFHFLFERPERRSHEDVEILVDAHSAKRMTAGQLREDSLRFAGGLRQLGAESGQTIAMFASNDIDYPIAIFGSLAAGLTLMFANPSYCNTIQQLYKSGARYFVTSPDTHSAALLGAKEVGIPESHVILMGLREQDGVKPLCTDGYNTMQTLLSAQPISAPVRLTPAEAATRTAYICYSSGTTDQPKAIEWTHRNVIASIQHGYEASNACTERSNALDVHVCILPLCKPYALMSLLHAAALRRICIVIMREFQLESMLQIIQRHQVTALCTTPRVCHMLVKDPLVDKYDLASLRRIACSASFIGLNMIEALRKRLSVTVLQGYGMTEAAGAILANLNVDSSNSSSGYLLPNYEAKIIDAAGNDVPLGEAGELCVRSPSIMKGYLNDSVATAKAIDADGFLHTGDFVRIDANGRYYVTGRIKELISYHHHKIVPSSLEALLQEHDAVVDAAVIGIHCTEQNTELPMAYVVLNPEYQGRVTEQELVAYINSRVAEHEQLRGGVEFIDAIPRLPAGKLLRRLLYEQHVSRQTQLKTSTTSEQP